jgi:hypothetical protein
MAASQHCQLCSSNELPCDVLIVIVEWVAVAEIHDSNCVKHLTVNIDANRSRKNAKITSI